MEIKSFLIPTFTFIGGHDNYFPSFNSDTIRWYQSLYDFSFGEWNNKMRRRLLWALVHSDNPEDVKCALIMLQGSLLVTNNLWKTKKLKYLLALVYYKSGNYLKSMELVDGCLEIAPQWSKACNLKMILQDRIKDDRVNGLLSFAFKTVSVGTGVVGLTTLFSYSTWVTEAITSIKDRLEKVVAATLPGTRNPMQLTEEIYLLSHRYYKRGNYSRSRLLIDCCLEIVPEWEPALTLKKSIECEWYPDLYP